MIDASISYKIIGHYNDIVEVISIKFKVTNKYHVDISICFLYRHNHIFKQELVDSVLWTKTILDYLIYGCDMTFVIYLSDCGCIKPTLFEEINSIKLYNNNEMVNI